MPGRPIERSRARGAAPLFAALGDETRLQLVERLAKLGPGSIARLSEKAAVTRQAITKHLEVLAGAGLVKSAWVGRERVWELEPKRLALAHQQLDALAKHWDAALERRRSVSGQSVVRDLNNRRRTPRK